MAKYELKTKKNDNDAREFIENITDANKRRDSQEIIELMQEVTGQSPEMWGKSIVGFGVYQYRGKTSEGEWMRLGFSPRKQNLTFYLSCDLDVLTDLLEKLGKYKRGVGCLYIKRLEDVDELVLKQLIKRAYKEVA